MAKLKKENIELFNNELRKDLCKKIDFKILLPDKKELLKVIKKKKPAR